MMQYINICSNLEKVIKMKILMIGLGSIGQRHLRNLSAHLGKSVEFFAYRVRGLHRTFSETMKIRENVIVEEEYNIRTFFDLNEALLQKPDIAYITNITNQHIPCAIKAINAGCDIFLEKPVSNNMEGVHELFRAKEKNKKIVFVGFQNRYHPVIRKLKELVNSNKFGKIISVQSEVGERLTTMHLYEDYAKTYMARKDQGGGVVMNQQIHELDYIQWIFGKPDSVVAICGKNSNLEIDVEDYCDSIYCINNDLGHFPVYCHADFFQYPPSRKCKVIFENGWILADLNSATIEYAKDDHIEKERFVDFTRNQMFVDEMKEFLSCVKVRTCNFLTLEEGIISMKMALAAKKSSMTNQIEKID